MLEGFDRAAIFQELKLQKLSLSLTADGATAQQRGRTRKRKNKIPPHILAKCLNALKKKAEEGKHSYTS